MPCIPCRIARYRKRFHCIVYLQMVWLTISQQQPPTLWKTTTTFKQSEAAKEYLSWKKQVLIYSEAFPGRKKAQSVHNQLVSVVTRIWMLCEDFIYWLGLMRVSLVSKNKIIYSTREGCMKWRQRPSVNIYRILSHLLIHENSKEFSVLLSDGRNREVPCWFVPCSIT